MAYNEFAEAYLARVHQNDAMWLSRDLSSFETKKKIQIDRIITNKNLHSDTMKLVVA